MNVVAQSRQEVLANINLGTDSLDLINFSVFLDHPRQFHSVPPPRSLVSKRWDAAYPGTVTAVLQVLGRLSINGLDWGNRGVARDVNLRYLLETTAHSVPALAAISEDCCDYHRLYT
ncbi:hypothetical protein DTO280E4_2991 [Paecilomyces variotii]|nr:hypothetical protein DTO169E5_2457 [Paecilomyces variotii]KAJ9260661.1 hypothetical protein DTO195F2_4501 [Paecilomyces variotii]KAJ9362956.1 hypothetical protein DTO280E4_2991 [Paecilomyces variotii]